MNAAKRCVLALVFAAAFGDSRWALASSPEEADGLFRQGRAAMNEENYEDARSYFQQSLQLDRALGTVLNLAVCEEKLGKLSAALAHLQEALALAADDDERRPLIVQRISRMDARLPRLTIQPNASIDATVTIFLDSRPLGPAELGRPIRVDPGTHLLECSGPHEERCTRLFQVSEGKESVQIPTLIVAPATAPASHPAEAVGRPIAEPPAPHPSPPLLQRPASERRAVAYAVGGFSLATVVVGLIAGAGVLRQKAIVAAHCENKACDEEGVNAADTGRTLSTISTVTVAVGAAGLGVSAYVLLSTPSAANTTAGLSIAGAF